jgi:hypothetical protein
MRTDVFRTAADRGQFEPEVLAPKVQSCIEYYICNSGSCTQCDTAGGES